MNGEKEKPILVYGSRNFSITTRALITGCGFNFSGLIDDVDSGDEILGNFEQVKISHPPEQYNLALAIGYNNLPARRNVYDKVTFAGYNLPNLIHPTAWVHDSVLVGDGVMVMAGVIVDLNVKIDSVSVLWPGVVINHDSIVGSNTFLSPNVTLCGATDIGNNSFIGAGAVITDHVKVPDNSFVRAGEICHNRTTYRKKND